MNQHSVLNLRLPPELALWLRAQAQAHRRSINGQAVFLFEEAKRAQPAELPPVQGAAPQAAQQQ